MGTRWGSICNGGGDRGLSEGHRPLEALLSRASAWEMESKEGAVKSSSRESDKQMGSREEDEGGWRQEARATAEVNWDTADPMVMTGFWTHTASYKNTHRESVNIWADGTTVNSVSEVK